ncbi:uncharacterized protein MCYG_05861 [Microsporum canis CBS 113480]|uniref:Uncharacterized protein n=1 Tax=Arthroderma otae (strain ATCC MYA-4605 / CBS 113480) TaxID=554155 RepID=C5FT39_ARTOC|nr:uncharacterized protein MCYG_05861 [Microsporum canis CBS 113480]EEQ33042.1 predicted protein [Microsporum canis CBS 113480]
MGRHDADLPNCLLFLYCSMIISAVHAEFGPNLEKVFDIIGAWRVAEMALRQRDTFLGTMAVELALKGRAEEIENLDIIGPKNWQEKLSDSKERLWNHEKCYLVLLNWEPIQR